MTIDLIDPSAYAQPSAAPHMSPGPSALHPDDEKLLEDDTHTPQVSIYQKLLLSTYLFKVIGCVDIIAIN